MEEELKVCPRSPMMPMRWGKADADTAWGVVKLCSLLQPLSGSPHLHTCGN